MVVLDVRKDFVLLAQYAHMSKYIRCLVRQEMPSVLRDYVIPVQEFWCVCIAESWYLVRQEVVILDAIPSKAFCDTCTGILVCL